MKDKRNSVFVATSMDGYIADRHGRLDWLQSVPNPDNIDMGYHAFMAQIDALVMGRRTFDIVCGFDMEWPYQKPVFVLSHTLKEIPGKLKDKAHLLSGYVSEVLGVLHAQGYDQLYIDGGAIIRSFLKEDLIDDMIITVIPVLLGGGVPLFSDLPETLEFECTDSKIFLDGVVQNHYTRIRENTNTRNE